MFSSKQTHKFNYFICYHLESGVARDQTQPGSFSREREEAWERGCEPCSILT